MNSRLGDKISVIELHHDLKVIVQEEIGFNDLFAEQIAEAITRGLCRRLGSQHLYIPAPDRSDRDEAIRREFNGRNIDEVMARHGVSRATVYRVAK